MPPPRAAWQWRLVLARTLEPEVMDDAAQARAYAQGDFAGVNQAFVDRFRSTFPDLSRGRVLDLGSGPADIGIRLVRALPALRVTGVDASHPMLDEARAAVERVGLRDAIALVRARLPDLPFPSGSFDAVLANSLLHHLPEPAVFWRVALRVARPGAALLVTDLLRPDSDVAARAIVDRYAANEPELLRRDFHRSLLAAFTLDEVHDQVEALGVCGLACVAVSDRHWSVSGRL